MTFLSFFYNYFISPINNYSGYNIVNTFTYVTIALVLFFFVIVPLIKKWYGKLDFTLFLYVLSVVFVGSMVRVSEETYSNIQWVARSANPLNVGFWFITPGIYFMITFFALVLLGISRFLKIKYNMNQKYFLFSITLPIGLVIFLLYLVKMTFFWSFVLIILSILSLVFIVYLIAKFVFKFKFNKFELLAIGAQLTDGIATFSALTFFPYFQEQHVFSGFFISHFGTWIFPVIKFILTIVLILVLRKMDLNENTKLYILLFITLFGFATGIRDIFSIANHLILGV